jgi:hypothetical protein
MPSREELNHSPKGGSLAEGELRSGTEDTEEVGRSSVRNRSRVRRMGEMRVVGMGVVFSWDGWTIGGGRITWNGGKGRA